MSQLGEAAVAVKMRDPVTDRQLVLQLADRPPRSRLYGIVPREGGTLWAECLTSYLNRLSWRHGVSPRALVAHELVPLLSADDLPRHLATFCRQGAMGLNGAGSLARVWSTLLERLTGRADLGRLTLLWWIGHLAERGHLRAAPAWCPSCYTDWQEQHLPIYQPLLWMFQAVTMCPRHRRRLEEHCPQCHKPQSAIATHKGKAGECTQCGAWLGAGGETHRQAMSDAATLEQLWIVHALEELRMAILSSEGLEWRRFFTGLATCLKERGTPTSLARLTGIPRSVFYRWCADDARRDSYTPSLETILKLCSACGVTPFQVISGDLAPLRRSLHSTPRPPLPQPPGLMKRRVDQQRCHALLRAVLDGQEEPLGIRQIAKRLGHETHTLTYNFPQECMEITALAQEYRKQRREERLGRVREQVRQAAITIHAQGVYPSHRRLRATLPRGWMRMPEANATWHATLLELGLERGVCVPHLPNGAANLMAQSGQTL